MTNPEALGCRAAYSQPSLGATRLLKIGSRCLEIQTEVERGCRLVTCVFAKGRVVAHRTMPLPTMTAVDPDIIQAAVKAEQREIVRDILARLSRFRPTVAGPSTDVPAQV